MEDFIFDTDLKPAIVAACTHLSLSRIWFRETAMTVCARYKDVPWSETRLMTAWLSVWNIVSWPYDDDDTLRRFGEAVVEVAEKALRERESRLQDSSKYW